MNRDEHPYSMLSSYSHQNRMNTTHQHPLRGHILHPAPRQYNAASEFLDNYGNGPQPSMLHNTPRYRVSSRTVKEEHDLNTYIYSTPIGFRGEMNLNVHHHPTHTPDHNTIRYSASHNQYSSDVNSSNSLRMASSPLELPEARLASGPPETGSADFRYQLRAALHQPDLLHPQRHLHGSLHHHQHPNHSLNHLQGSSAFYSSPINYSSQDQENGSPNGMDAGLDQPQAHSSLEYDSRESHVSVPPGMVYDSLAVSSHSQQGAVRPDTNMNPHHGSLTSSNSGSGGAYHTSNPPDSSIPMSNNHDTASSINTSVLGAHISSPYSIGTGSSLGWASHPSSFDMPGSTTSHSQIPTPASISTSSSSLRHSLRHANSNSRLTPPENSFTQDYSHLRTSTSTQTLSSSHSHTNSPSPLSDNGSTSPGGGGSEMFSNNNLDDRDGSDPDVEPTAIRMSEDSTSAGRKAVVVIRASEEEMKKEASTPPVKKKKKSKMHCCEVCSKKFPRPSGLKTHMNTHSNEKPYPCGFPGCTRSFGVRSNAKRHLRTHGVIPTPASNPNPTDPPYIVGFCTPMIGAPQPSSSSHHQLHSIEGGGEKDFPPPGGSGLPGDHNAANIHHHIQDHQGQNDVQQQHEMMGSAVPTLKLRWMPPSLTTRTNAGSLREVVDEQQQQQQQMQHWMGDVVEEEADGEEDDDFVTGGNGTSIISHTRRRSGGVYDTMDTMDQRLTVSRSAAECTTMYSPPSSESPSTQGICRPSSSPSSRIIATSISPPSRSSSFARSNSSLSPPSAMSSGYGQQQHDIDHITNVGGGCDVLYTTRTENISREYGGV